MAPLPQNIEGVLLHLQPPTVMEITPHEVAVVVVAAVINQSVDTGTFILHSVVLVSEPVSVADLKALRLAMEAVVIGLEAT